MIEITYQDSATPISELNRKADTLQFELVDNISMMEWEAEDEPIIYGAPSLGGGTGPISDGEVVPIHDTYNINDFILREFSYIYIPETNEVEFSFICPSGRSLTNPAYIKVKDNDFVSPTYKTLELRIYDDDGAVGYDRKVIFRYSFDNSNIREIYNSIIPSKYTPIIGGNARKASSSNKYVTKSSYENLILSENIENHLLDDKGRIQRTEEHYYKIFKTLKIKSNSLVPNAAGNYYSSKSELTNYSEEYLFFQGECSYDLYDGDRNLLKEDIQETTPYVLMRCTMNPSDSLVGKIKLPMNQTYNLYYRGVIFYEDFDGNVQEIVSSNYVNVERFKLAEITPTVDNASYSENGYPLFIVGSQKGEKISFKIKVNKVQGEDDQYIYPDITSITRISTTDQSNNGLSEYEDPNDGLFQVGINNQLWDRQPNPGYDNWRISSDRAYYDKNTGQITLYVIAQQTNDELDPWRPQYTKILPLLATTTISYTYNEYFPGDDVLDGGWFPAEDSVTVSYYVVQKSSHLGIKPVQYDSASSSTYEFCESDNSGHYLVTVPSTPGIRKVFLGIVSEVDPYSSIVENWNIEETSLDDREYFFENYSGGYNDKIVLYTSINKEPPKGEEYATLHSFKVSDHIIHSTIWRRAIYESTVEIIPIIYPQEVDLGLLSYKITGCTSKFFYKKYRLFFFNNNEKEHEFRLVFERNGDPGVDPTNFTIDSKSFIAGNINNATDNDEYTYHVASEETEDGELIMTVSKGIPTSNVKIVDIIKKENKDLSGKINEVIIKLKYPDETSITDPGINFMKTSDSLPLSFELGFGFDGGYQNYPNQSIKFYCAEGILKSLGVQKPETQEVYIPAGQGESITSIPISTYKFNDEFPIEEINVISPITDETFNDWDYTTSSKYFNFSNQDDEYKNIIGHCGDLDFDFEYYEGNDIGTLLVQGKSDTGGTDLVNFFRVNGSLSESLNNWKFYVYNSLPAQFNFTSAEGSSSLVIKGDNNEEISELLLNRLGIYRVYVTIKGEENESLNGTLSARLSGTNSDKIIFSYFQPTVNNEDEEIDLDFSNTEEIIIPNNSVGATVSTDTSSALYFKFFGLKEDFNSFSDDLKLTFHFVENGGKELEKSLKLISPIPDKLTEGHVSLDYYINDSKISDTISTFPVNSGNNNNRYLWIPVNSEDNSVGKVILNVDAIDYPYKVSTEWIPGGKTNFIGMSGGKINADQARLLGQQIFNIENTINLKLTYNQEEEVFENCYLTGSLNSQTIALSVKDSVKRDWSISSIGKQLIDLMLQFGPISSRMGDIKTDVIYLPPIKVTNDYSTSDIKLKINGSGGEKLNPKKIDITDLSNVALATVCSNENSNYPMSITLASDKNSSVTLELQSLDYVEPWLTQESVLQALAQVCQHSYSNLQEKIGDILKLNPVNHNETTDIFKLITQSNSYAAKLSVALEYTTYHDIAIAKLNLPIKYLTGGGAMTHSDTNYTKVINKHSSTLFNFGWFKIGQVVDYEPMIDGETIPSIPEESFKKTIRIPARFFAGKTTHEIKVRAENIYSLKNDTHTTHIIKSVTARGAEGSLNIQDPVVAEYNYGFCPCNQYIFSHSGVIDEDVYLDLKFNEVVYTVYNTQKGDPYVGGDDCYRYDFSIDNLCDHVFHVTNPTDSNHYFSGGSFSPGDPRTESNRASAGLTTLMGGTVNHTITLEIDGVTKKFDNIKQNGYNYYVYLIGAQGVSTPNNGGYYKLWYIEHQDDPPISPISINALYVFPTKQLIEDRSRSVFLTFHQTVGSQAGMGNLVFCELGGGGANQSGTELYLSTKNYNGEWVPLSDGGGAPNSIQYHSNLWGGYLDGGKDGDGEGELVQYYYYWGGTFTRPDGTKTDLYPTLAHHVAGEICLEQKNPENPARPLTLMTIHTNHGG